VPDTRVSQDWWFGESWGALICTLERHRPIPVGHLCVACMKPMEVTSRGVCLVGGRGPWLLCGSAGGQEGDLDRS
jgi:hypothetical protein